MRWQTALKQPAGRENKPEEVVYTERKKERKKRKRTKERKNESN